MRTIFLLCATFALSLAAEPVKEEPAAPETHQDGSVKMLDRTEEKEEEVIEKIQGDAKRNSCPPGWSKYGSRCFIYIHKEVPWVDAEKFCVRNGANLASVHNPGEYEFIQEVVRGSTGRFPQAWIGGNDAIKDFVWLWSDGSGFYYQDWSMAEPDNHENSEKCVVMNRPGTVTLCDNNLHTFVKPAHSLQGTYHFYNTNCNSSVSSASQMTSCGGM
uniref:galactose-specific lectin nattectin-like n=1 Tax=Epinephelus lanceolatus TaxID=310571 RepID=UPI0014475330|nr:galactose-specific lectin nattectin-like [Epinephelus lanceolatus]